MSPARIRLALLGLTLGLGQAAEADGLFPNIYIRRVRPNCDTESPSTKMHREVYFGYQPTEWRRFPEGWGYRHPEIIDRAALMKEVEAEVKKLDEEFGPGSRSDDEMDDGLPPRGGRGTQDEGGGAAVPRPIPLPDDTDSPFNLDNRQPARPTAPTSPPGTEPPVRQTAPAAPELPKPGDSPFDLPRTTPPAPVDDIPPRPRTGTNPPVGMMAPDFDEIAAVEAPMEVMRAPQRNALRDTLGSLNPLNFFRR